MNHEVACCIQVVDAGSRNSINSSTKTPEREIIFGWEILTDQVIDSAPRIAYKSYTLKWTKPSELREDIQSWLGDELTEERIRRFSPKSMLGKYCMLELDSSVDATGKKTNLVQKIMPLPNGFDQSKLVKPNTPFGIFMASEPDFELLESLPAEIKTQIINSTEFASAQNASDDDYE